MDDNTVANIFTVQNNLYEHIEIEYKLYGERKISPTVSIMIPTFKRPEILKNAIRSSLAQDSEVSFEVVVIDNNPDTKDEDVELLMSEFCDERLAYYRNSENIGMFGNWNRCIELANGKWILILNDDDELMSNYLSVMMKYLDKLGQCGAISCNHVLIDGNGNEISVVEKKRKNKIIPVKIRDFYFIHPTNIYGCLFNKDVAIQCGGFDEKMYPCSDAAFLINICVSAPLYLATDVLFRYRWAVNESQNPKTLYEFAKFNLLKAYYINRKYKFFKGTLDQFMRDCLCNYTEKDLLKKGVLNQTEVEKFRKEMHCSNEYYSYKRLIARIINKMYKILFKNRKFI